MGFYERLRQFMMGRYGGDSLNTVLSTASFAGFIAGMIGRAAAPRSVAGLIICWVLYLVAFALMGFGIFRTLSRNLVARRAEYEWYRSHIKAPMQKRRNESKIRRAQAATHRFFKCPKCRQTVRVPKGKGKIKITCPKCGNSFVKKS